MIIHYNCTIGSILLDSFLLIYHPYPPSFHEMIFILVYLVMHQHILSHIRSLSTLFPNLCLHGTLKCIYICSTHVQTYTNTHTHTHTHTHTDKVRPANDQSSHGHSKTKRMDPNSSNSTDRAKLPNNDPNTVSDRQYATIDDNITQVCSSQSLPCNENSVSLIMIIYHCRPILPMELGSREETI